MKVKCYETLLHETIPSISHRFYAMKNQFISSLKDLGEVAFAIGILMLFKLCFSSTSILILSRILCQRMGRPR
jgi:hypothetical protein